MSRGARRALAWVPFSGDVRRADRAVEWTVARCEAEGRPGVVMGDPLPQEGPLAWFAGRYQGVVRPGEKVRLRGPVLAHEPTLGWLPDALAAARRTSLCVLAGPESLVEGWAMTAGTVDLTTGAPTVDTRTREQRSMHSFLLYAGGLQWGDDHGRGAALTPLRHLAATGLPLETTLGVMLAFGATTTGLENLRALALR